MVFPLPDKYIDLLTDFGFKRVFGTEPNKALLIDFLNTLLPPHHQIQDVTIKNPEFLGKTLVDRRAIFDIYCQSTTGERFIVEMQKAKQTFFKDRSVYYATFPIQEQAQQGNWNYQLTAVYTVGILDFSFDDHKHDSELLHVVELKNQRCEVFYDKLKFIYVELPKFTKSVDQLETHFDKWLFLFRHLASCNAPPEPLQGDVFAQLFEVAEIANFSSEEQALYQDSLKVYRDMYSVNQTLIQEGRQEGLEQGRQEGLQQGLEQGRQEGLQQGLEQGRQEGQQAGEQAGIQKVVKQMKAAGLSLKDIAQYTGLSMDDIDQL
ncbi:MULTISPECIES: Rpn family recombination-promoting nuclease/putative transposase [unclassified Moorena]|uniref:Rpn family recombination-promoting nuclease/putative transposase n=1 Tax=unclassified Moorena TaxID=2683338 RepID=UPI0013FF49C8|nr:MULTISPECIES: Rpn family recombination-promoting nuclease/putative transposase [unclassified Moorena]NEO15951.1 Rpn family recombination-promoting nuclease/putative transposase [Moorena sp. SIO3E8]NEP99778.1 Rpn family recombination-promoting nuclease/putative transposase [Moorena sp. SIO3F7]